MNSIWQFSTAGSIRFGRGSAISIADELARFHCDRPIVITDSILIEQPLVQQVLHSIRSRSNVAIFAEGIPEPPIETALSAIVMGQTHDADSVIAIGGGSNIDVAKIVAMVLRHGGYPRDYFGFDRVPGPILPLFALPTTAGTGSEVSHSAVLTDSAEQTKISTLSRWLRPTVAIVDPGLTDSCPPRVTAHSGIDALVHAIEAFTNRPFQQMIDVDPQARAYEGSYPLTRLIAAQAIRNVSQYLLRAVRSPSDHEARDGMALASLLAGMAFSNSGVALVHALEYPIGALTHCSHGEGNGLLLPHVMRYNLPASTEAMALVAEHLGCERGSNSNMQLAQNAIEVVEELIREIGIRTHLSQLGLLESQIEAVANRAFQIKRLMDVNPRTPTLAELVEILRSAY
jgi:alcohol dehydrogenase class IV